jgi:DNA-binding IscR family transcriptional regulator
LLKISDAVNLAFHAMLFLAADPDRHLSVQDLAKHMGVSDNHLSKVMLDCFGISVMAEVT